MWYELSVKQQYDVKLLILHAQQKREIRGFDYIVCSLGTFLRVIYLDTFDFENDCHFDFVLPDNAFVILFVHSDFTILGMKSRP